jgi:hypothetical protein
VTDAEVTGLQVDAFSAGEPDAAASGLAVEPFNTGAPAAAASGLGVDAFNIGAPDAAVSGLAIDAWNIGAPAAAVSSVAVEVFRTIRDAPFPTFPARLFNPPTYSVRLADGAVEGPLPLAGDPGLEAFANGGRWVFDFAETPLPRRDQLLAWRELSAAADWGATSVIVPVCDRRHQALDPVAYAGDDLFGLRVWHDVLHWAPDQVESAFAVTYDRGATTVSFSFDGPVAVEAGVQFSVLGRHWGWRLYRIVRVISDLAGVVTAEIRPPLREWAKAGELLNFDTPRCTCRIDGPIEPMLERLRLGQGVARFVETFSRTP